MDSVKDFLQDWGLWTLLLLMLGHWISGVLAAFKENTFKWFYVANILKDDGLKLAAYALIIGLGRYSGIDEFNTEAVKAGLGVVLGANMTADIFKNLNVIFPTLPIPTTLAKN